jgi:tRNA nucleotidyltransferase (CCA-adding enzyme)
LRAIDLSDLPAERIWGEMEKLLAAARAPSIGLEWLRKLGVIEKLFPEIQSLIGVPQDPEWHPEGDVFVHTQLVIDRARELIDDLSYPRQVTVMLAALAHDLASRRRRSSSRAGGVRVDMKKRACRRLRVFSIASTSHDRWLQRARQVIALVRETSEAG